MEAVRGTYDERCETKKWCDGRKTPGLPQPYEIIQTGITRKYE